VLRKRMLEGLEVPPPSDPAGLRILLHDSLLTAEKLTGPFWSALARRGWLMDKIVVEPHRRRARW
jgi:hypothetical protein